MVKLRIFELIEPLESGSNAKAALLVWNGHTYVANKKELVTLQDYIGEHGLKGDRGYCYLCEESGQWEVLSGLFSQEYQRVG